MSTIYRIIFCLIAVVIIISLFSDNCVEAKGGRGGGFRSGGFRSSRSRSFGSRSGSRSRARNTVAGRVRSTLRSRSFNWKTAAAAGYIYGWSRYSHSPRYRSYPNRRPQICVNLYDYRRDNGTTYQMFICPLHDQPEDYKYCCGPEDRQRCCRFWDSGARVFGVVVAIIVAITIPAVIIYCCCCKKSKTPGFVKASNQQDVGAKYTMTPNTEPLADMAGSYPQKPDPAANGAPYPPSVNEPNGGTAPYPPAPGVQPMAPGYQAAPYPPDQNTPYPQGGTPYPPNPAPQPGVQAGAPYPPMPAQGYDPGQGNTPYPLNPPGPGGYPAAAPPPYPAN